MKKLWMCGIGILAGIGLASCYPEGPEYVHEKDIALTHYDEKADFSDYKTFVMPDSVVFVCADGDSLRISEALEQKLLGLVKQNLQERNFQLLSAEEGTQSPDFVVTLTAFSVPTFNYTTWGNYWGWYSGWDWFGWGGLWGHFYPWYPWYGGSYVYYAYDYGTLTIDMLDAKNADAESGRIPVLWSGVNRGILSGSKAYLEARVERSINQCFIQSPYLKTTK